MSELVYVDPWTPEKVLEIYDRWTALRKPLAEFIYGMGKDQRPEITNNLLHDGNRAANMARISSEEDQERSLRVRWGGELDWFVRIGEYVLELEKIKAAAEAVVRDAFSDDPAATFIDTDVLIKELRAALIAGREPV